MSPTYFKTNKKKKRNKRLFWYDLSDPCVSIMLDWGGWIWVGPHQDKTLGHMCLNKNLTHSLFLLKMQIYEIKKSLVLMRHVQSAKMRWKLSNGVYHTVIMLEQYGLHLILDFLSYNILENVLDWWNEISDPNYPSSCPNNHSSKSLILASWWFIWKG